MSNDGASIVSELEKASEGLLYQSESDYPFKPFLWKGEGKEPLTEARLLSLSGQKPDKLVVTTDLEDLFRVATRDQDWHGPREKEGVRRNRDLVKLIEEKLEDVVVFRVGEVEIDIYIVGKTPSGDLAGLSTKAVET
jgi:hypothetical protein